MLNSFFPKIQTLFIKYEFKFEFVLLHTPLSYTECRGECERMHGKIASQQWNSRIGYTTTVAAAVEWGDWRLCVQRNILEAQAETDR